MWRVIGKAVLIATSASAFGGCGGTKSGEVELVNVSYDPTRELYREINEAFTEDYLQRTGTRLRITQSHGGSGSQARAVIDGLRADVVTLALAGDIEALQKKGLIAEGWQARLPNNSCPYTSTIVLLVRTGNPLGIKDWPDLVRSDVRVITPNPKTSGGARWNFLAAWGFVAHQQGRGEVEATEFIRRLCANVPKLDTGARGSTDTFAKRRHGDVLIAWENEAILLRKESQEGLEIVYPSASILAEPPVAWVDQWTTERSTTEIAEKYLTFLYSEPAQDIIARHGYRPFSPAASKKHAALFPAIKLFSLKEVAGDWEAAQAKFFADGGIFDQVYQPRGAR
jgi:sulfate transport system substrate-binding protein